MNFDPILIPVSMSGRALKVAYRNPDEAVAVEVGWIVKVSSSFILVKSLIHMQGRLPLSKEDPEGFAVFTRSRFAELGVDLDEAISRQISDGVQEGRRMELEFSYRFAGSEDVVRGVLGLFG